MLGNRQTTETIRTRIEIPGGAVLFVRAATKRELDDAAQDIGDAIERALDPAGPDADAIKELVELDSYFQFPAEITAASISETLQRLVLIRLGAICGELTLEDVGEISARAPSFQWLMASLLTDPSFENAMRAALAVNVTVNVRFAPRGATTH